MKFIGTDLERNIERDMFEYMPREYADYRESMAMVQAEAGEFEKLNDKVRDVLDQFFIDTATWGLANWERIFGIVADESKPLEQRRSVIKSKLRGYGTVTAAFIKNVAESFENGAVDVVEDAANYTVKITFIDTRGVPGNLDDIKKALRDIIPAHLAISFEFTYLRWSEFDAKNYTWSTLEAKALTWDQFERLK